MLKILHLFPPYPVSLNGTGWIAGTARAARHIAVHAFDPRRPLNTAASAWVSGAEQVWIVGGSRNLSSEIHGKWLIPEEAERIRAMDRRCAYIRNSTGAMGVVTRIADSATSPPESHKIRTRAAA